MGLGMAFVALVAAMLLARPLPTPVVAVPSSPVVAVPSSPPTESRLDSGLPPTGLSQDFITLIHTDGWTGGVVSEFSIDQTGAFRRRLWHDTVSGSLDPAIARRLRSEVDALDWPRLPHFFGGGCADCPQRRLVVRASGTSYSIELDPLSAGKLPRSLQTLLSDVEGVYESVTPPQK